MRFPEISQSPAGVSDAGFVATDALVALTLMALVLGLAVGTAKGDLWMVRAAMERGGAGSQLQLLIASQWPALRAPGSVHGPANRAFGTVLQAEFAKSDADFDASLCRVRAIARGASGRRYMLETVKFCSPVGG
jgi:hypothetical protein